MLGKWIKPEYVGSIESMSDGGQRWSGAYKDYCGNRHDRTVECHENIWLIEDHLSGPFKNAEIRYRLTPAQYRLEGNRLIAPWGAIEVEAPECCISMARGHESLYYWEKKPVDELVFRVGQNSRTIKTKFKTLTQ